MLAGMYVLNLRPLLFPYRGVGRGPWVLNVKVTKLILQNKFEDISYNQEVLNANN